MSLFVAVEVPEEVRAAVHAAWPAVHAAAPHLRPTAEVSWHITLVFLGRGNLEPEEGLHRALAALCRRHQPFDVGLDGRADTFGRRVLWASFRPCPALAALAADARETAAVALAGGGVEVQQAAGPFTAHLTLARAPRGGPGVPPAAVEAYSGPRRSWRVADVQLLSSSGRPRGGRYTVEGQWPLSG